MEKIDTDTLIQLFKEDCKLKDMTKESIRSYISEIKIYRDFLKNNGFNIINIENQVLEKFLKYLKDTRNNSQSRIENYFSALSSFYDFLIYKGFSNKNIIIPFRKRYVKRYKKNITPAERKLLSVEDMAHFVNSIIPIRDKAIAIVFAKTGIRRGELLGIEVDDIDWDKLSIMLKPFHKRSNRLIFFDEETKVILNGWLKQREKIVDNGITALFINDYGQPIGRSGVYNAIIKWAKKLGYYNDSSDKLEDHFSIHNFRHWFTTWLLRNGMPREYVKELRGDNRGEAIDIYHHIDKNDLRKVYLATIPQLGI